MISGGRCPPEPPLFFVPGGVFDLFGCSLGFSLECLSQEVPYVSSGQVVCGASYPLANLSAHVHGAPRAAVVGQMRFQ